MQLYFLGTSSGVPTITRNVSSMALRLPQRSDLWLFDCGEGTQQQLLRSSLRSSQIKKIFITHMHGDHLYGLPGLISSLGLAGSTSALSIYGPPGIDEYITHVMRLSHTGPAFALQVVEYDKPGVLLQDGDFSVSIAPLVHRVPTWGFRIAEAMRPGAFLKDKALADGIAPGPLFGQLKQGLTIKLPDGRTLDGRNYTGAPQPGRVCTLCCDTEYCRTAVELARGADVLVHEATFAEAERSLATERGHSTAADAARIAVEAGARALILTHVSPRYNGDARATADLLSQAQALHGNVHLAEDFWQFEVKRGETNAAD